jgi:Uma2 family endonuclease
MVTETLTAAMPPKSTILRKRPISLTYFLDNYTDREDPFKYEWNNGLVEKKPRTMNRDQFPIFQNLLRLLIEHGAIANGGLLMAEVDMHLPNFGRTRRTDMAYLTPEMMKIAKDNRPTVCPFVVEVVSKNDQINEVSEKVIEYFESGVAVVWVVQPYVRKVEVYTAVDKSTICFGKTLCSLDPVLKGVAISVDELLD